MPREGWRPVIIREEIYNKLQEYYQENKKHNPFLTFSAWLTEYLLEVIEQDEILRRKAPALAYAGTDGRSIFIKDELKDRIVEVIPRSEKRVLYCLYCESDNCIHVGFSFAIKEVAKVLKVYGFKEPKVKDDTDEDKEE